MSHRRLEDDPDFEIIEIIDLKDAAPPLASSSAQLERTAAARSRREVEAATARRLLRALLPALDALECCVRERPSPAALDQGVRVALRQLWDVFRAHTLERIEGEGMTFDPRIHEAAEITPSSRAPTNTVLETLRVGYLLGDELVRPALVRVSVEDRAANTGCGGGQDT